MKLFIVGLALLAVAHAQYSPSAEYLPPNQEAAIEIAAPSNEYLAPAVEEQQTVLADDGYRYKTVRRFRNRNRRDVSELPSAQYLPPQQESVQSIEVAAPSNEYLAPAVEEQQTVLADDGYRYKTVRRFRNRNRREAQYLPPHQESVQEIEVAAPSNEYLAPAVEEQQTVLADDGYRYKTVRRFRNRNRREAQYLPPHQESVQEIEVAAPSNEYLAPAVEEQQTALADDGYRYKTVRRFRNRNRREAQYLPPHQESVQEIEIAAPSNEYLAPAVEEQQTVLADDGYRYKTVRRFRNRNRREAQYLPPHQESVQEIEVAAPSNEYLAPDVEEQQTVLADDGYRYKTVRRFRNRNRREAQYLPPHQESVQEIEVAAPSNEYLAPAVEEQQTALADDGYRYKTVRRFRNRNRREAQYLPPHQESVQEIEIAAPSNEYLVPAVEEEQTALADDGYRYKTVRRFRNRNRRDVSELPSAQYLPPQQESVQSFELAAPSNEYLAPSVEEQQTVLADDGYRYKTVKKFKVRRH